MADSTLYLLIGYVGSALVVASLSMRSIMKLRLVGLAGAFVFILYGVLIVAWPVVFTNVVIVAIHLHFLREILTAKEYFRVLEVRQESQYLKYFLECYCDEIEAIWPGFVFKPTDRHLTLFILRDLVPAGLFIAEIQDDETVCLELDFAIPGYRDFKIARYLYDKGKLYERGFRRVIVRLGSESTSLTRAYLQRFGFQPDAVSGRDDVLSRTLEPGS